MVHLFINTYQEARPERRAEIEEAIARNKRCRHITRVHEINSPARPTIGQMLDEARRNVGWADIAILANSDIYFDDTAELLQHIGYEECFALARYEGEQSEQLCEYPRGMQDAWVFRGPPPRIDADFPLGKYAGDNRLSKLLQDAGYTLYNPSFSIKIHHLHASGLRPVHTEANKVPGPYLYLPPCSLNEIRRKSTDPIEEPGRIAIIQMGRFGDIVNSLPIAFDLRRQGNEIFWYVSPEFAPLLDGVSYVMPVIWDGPLKEPEAAIEHAKGRNFDRVMALQIEGNPEPAPQKTQNYSTESWVRAGYLDKYHILPCVFDRAKPPPGSWKPTGGKPILAYCLEARTSPYAADLKRDLQQWLTDHFSADFDLLPIGGSQWPPDALAVVLREASVIISVDSFPLHMSYAAGTPAIAIVPHGWLASEPRRNWIESIGYAQSTLPEGREKIAAALRAVLANNIQPGRLIAQPGNLPPPTFSHLRLLSILIPCVRSRESILKLMLDRLVLQLAGHSEIEVIVEMDEGQTKLSEKRNKLLNLANGRYCCFIDDDDRPSDNFVLLVVQALRDQPDCVGFKVARFESGKLKHVEIRTLGFDDDVDPPPVAEGEVLRPIGCVCPIRTALARKIGFGDGGDDEFSAGLAKSGLLESEQFINAVLYSKSI